MFICVFTQMRITDKISIEGNLCIFLSQNNRRIYKKRGEKFMFNSKRMISSIASCVIGAQILASIFFNPIGLSKVGAASTDGTLPKPIQTPAVESNKSILLGDVDANGQIDSVDFARMRMHLLGMITSFPASNGSWASDVSGDGVFNSIDFAFMRQYMLGFIKKFPAESSIVTPTPSINVTSTPTPIIKASNIEEVKKALIQNFDKKGTTFTLTYSGDVTDLENKVSQAIIDAAKESDEPFMLLEGVSWEAGGSSGQLQLIFTFPYDDENQYTVVTRSTDEFKKALSDGFYNRTQNINIIYKGIIEDSDIIDAQSSILNNDTYMNLCIDKCDCNVMINEDMEISAINFICNYKTTKEEEAFIDKKVEEIISLLIYTDMTDDEKEKLIHDYVIYNVLYSGEEEYGSAYGALYYGRTKCDGYAMLTHKMLKAAGIENIIVTNEDHAWNVVKINDKWYHLDTTWDDRENDSSFYRYYNLSDDEINTVDEYRRYSSENGIKCITNYINDLSERNAKSGGKFDKLLKDIQEDRLSNFD